MAQSMRPMVEERLLLASPTLRFGLKQAALQAVNQAAQAVSLAHLAVKVLPAVNRAVRAANRAAAPVNRALQAVRVLRAAARAVHPVVRAAVQASQVVQVVNRVVVEALCLQVFCYCALSRAVLSRKPDNHENPPKLVASNRFDMDLNQASLPGNH